MRRDIDRARDAVLDAQPALGASFRSDDDRMRASRVEHVFRAQLDAHARVLAQAGIDADHRALDAIGRLVLAVDLVELAGRGPAVVGKLEIEFEAHLVDELRPQPRAEQAFG
jgi:hypothetical protein